jgi:L-ascorbate metabolism protein UlaG (beta-lactamase superfamily)
LTIAPGQTIEFDFVSVTAVPSYNTNKPNHPKSRNWVGFIIELGGKRIYVAGDTDLIEEMRSLEDIDVAFLPAGGTYTMNAVEAAEATQYIKPKLAIPYHWGQNVGSLADAQRFAGLARCAVKILAVGETIGSDEWPEYEPLIAHWALDEIEGDIAYDSAGDHNGALNGDPV